MQQQDTQRRDNAAPVLKASFLRAVGNGLRCHKLGSLLMAGGLITREELDTALAEHKDTGEPLGKVLIRRGAVSAVQIYRKLAEQWCLKASTAGVAMMMQVAAPNVAHADDSSLAPRFQVAAASVSTPSWMRPAQREKAPRYPQMMGTYEVRSSDLSAFTKWTSVISRFEEQMKTRSTTPRIMMWKSHLQSLRGSGARAQIEGVNDYINKVRYIEDRNNWKKSDYWATPVEFFSRGGDCEDFAIAKYASLRALGYSAEQMRVMIVQDKWKNQPHAVLVVYTDEGTFILDNQNKKVVYSDDVVRYQPIFSINSTHWWLHKSANS
ncbi:MAG: transglutaminase-like cysteine peptidase [Alphaproteobacteria bacterium]|nr:transglutaminase-like cysteine peptidase [Alphaproteobacteria bacterium]